MVDLKIQKNTTKNSSKSKTRLFLTGLGMGMADLVPGVSGGTVAFLMGIYDELLYSIRLITGEVIKLVSKGKLKQAFHLIPFRFLLPLALGILTAIFGFVRLVSFLISDYPVLVWALFFGLVLGSAYVVSRRIKQWHGKYYLLLALGFITTFALVGLPSLGGNESPLAIFLTGAIAITAMILPGISGSLIMVILGQYEIIINAVSNRNILIMSIFTAGVILGLALFVRLLIWLMKHYHLAVIAFITGVIAGSLRKIWPWQEIDPNGLAHNIIPAIDLSLVPTLSLALIGFILVISLEKFGIAKEHDDIKTNEFKKELKQIEQ